jgi:hypothetical protein
MSDIIPEVTSLSAALAAKSAMEAGDAAAANLQGKRILVQDEDEGNRYFISPVYPNAKFLAVAGQVEYANAPTGQLQVQRPAMRRVGDKWARFHSGVLTSNDPDIIEWCVAHSGNRDVHAAYHKAHGQNARQCSAPVGLCREQGEGIDDWFKLKQAQIPLATRPKALDEGIDVDYYFDAANRRNKGSVAGTVSAQIEADDNAAQERSQGRD